MSAHCSAHKDCLKSPMKITPSFHAQHSPMGAHSSFTIGMFGAPGGMALERGSPADSAVFVGYKTASGHIQSMPFYEGVDNDAERYSQSSAEGASRACVCEEGDIARDHCWGTDALRPLEVRLSVATAA